MNTLFKTAVLVVLLSLIPTSGLLSADTQENMKPMKISTLLGFEIPITNKDYFNLGGSALLGFDYYFGFFPYMSLGILAGYQQNPYETIGSVSQVFTGGGLGFRYPLGTRFRLYANAYAGTCFAFINSDDIDENGIGSAFMGSAGAEFLFNKVFGLGLTTSYKSNTGLYDGLGISLAVNIHLESQKSRDKSSKSGWHLEQSSINFDKIFPVFYSYYEENPLGSIRIKNMDSKSISNIELSLSVPDYMTGSKFCSGPTELSAGEEAKFDLYALFNNNILELTEGSRTSYEIKITYTSAGQSFIVEWTGSMEIQYRNAMIWDDDRKAAAFVTARDPEVMSFAKNAASLIDKSGTWNFNENLMKGIILYEAIRETGMRYTIDPDSSYAQKSEDERALDYLQFPRETLSYRGGDCDDLTILYCAILESLGVETAFVTVPGHILPAFSLGDSNSVNRDDFGDNLINFDEKIWIPLEITALDSGFMEAWDIGASQWHQYEAANAEIYPMRESWVIYNSVGLSGSIGNIPLPVESLVIKGFIREAESYIKRNIDPQVRALENEIQKGRSFSSTTNKIAVLYARYGLYDQAKNKFISAINHDSEYLPAIINLGNIELMKRNYIESLEYFDKALKRKPNNPRILLGIARSHHGMENYGLVGKYYKQLEEISPQLAEKYNYLDLKGEEALRASTSVPLNDYQIWEMEE